MPTTKEIPNLIINKIENLKVFEYIKANGLIKDDEVYIVDPVMDTELSTESINPVQNKVITEALNNKADKGVLNTITKDHITSALGYTPPAIDDTSSSEDKTWSSEKISSEITQINSNLDDHEHTADDVTYNDEKLSVKLDEMSSNMSQLVIGMGGLNVMINMKTENINTWILTEGYFSNNYISTGGIV